MSKKNKCISESESDDYSEAKSEIVKIHKKKKGTPIKKVSKEDKITSTKNHKKEKLIKKVSNEDKITSTKTHKNKYILQICDIPECITVDILKNYVRKDIDGNREYYDDLGITYKISNSTKAEWILSKAIDNCKLVGNGNTNVDIITDDISIDVSVLTLNKGACTNEKSIMQNFSTSGDLDSLFNKNKGEKAVRIFKRKLQEKFANENNDIYYAIFICHVKKIYLICLKFVPENINKMEFGKFSKSNKNISINNFINKNYGNVNLYKSKKRLELRLSKNIIDSKYAVRVF